MNNDIAVIGIGTRLPDAPTASAFWKNLLDGRCSVRDLSDEQLAAAGVPPRLARDPRYVKAGIVLDGFDQFDAEFFGFSPREAAIMDPQHRQFLECTWEALEDAAHPPARFDGAIGVFAGCGMGSYFAFQVLRNRQLMEEVGLFLLRHTGNDKDFLSTRVSYCLDLKGPSVNIQTACSTSLVAIHYACQSLLSGESDMAVAGGVTIDMPHGRGYLHEEGEILSPDGRCRAFDHRSRGTVFGSGAATVILRRLEDAVADGDHVYAVIKGSAINNDGRSKAGYLAPSVDGQAAAVAEALAIADVEPSEVSYVECHGTGTELGDLIEVSALHQAFADAKERQFCGLGSVKTNIGHLDTAAGVASFIKVCLALHHEQIPATINFEAPNPMIDFERSPFYVNDTLRPWLRSDRPRYAGVHSLGVGGTNAHVVVSEPPLQNGSEPDAASAPTLLAWSARNTKSLDEYGRKLCTHLRDRPDTPIRDVASTLAHGRHAFTRRRIMVSHNLDETLQLLEAGDPRRIHTHIATENAKVAFLLPGGGAQYRWMGRDLYRNDETFRQHVDRGLGLLKGELDVDLEEIWLGDSMPDAEVEALLDRPSVQLPAIFLCEFALARCWQSRGIKPSALLGHSLGENTAACLAGVFSFEDGLRLVTLRGKLFEEIDQSGVLSVALSEAALIQRLPEDLDLSVINAPELCAVSGRDEALSSFAKTLQAEEIETRRVGIAIAAHSRLLDPILDQFGSFLRSLNLSPPKIKIMSNLTGTWLTDELATDPDYWVRHLRNTVRFASGVDALLSDPSHVLLEVGPGRTLSAFARLAPKWSADRNSIASLRHQDEDIDDVQFLTGAHGRLWASGVDTPLESLVPDSGRRVSLPTYAWRHQRYWVDADPEGANAADEANTHRVEDISKWLWKPTWSRVESPAIDAASGTWIFFVDEIGVAQQMIQSMKSNGVTVIEVHLGDSFTKLDELRYALAPELGREGYDALLADISATGRQINGVMHGWLLTADRSSRPGSSFFHRCEERGFYSLLFLSQSLASEEQTEGVRVMVVTNELIGPDDDATCPEKSTVLGPCLVMPRELPGLTCSLVDVKTPAKPRSRRGRAELDALADTLLRELSADTDSVVALRGADRWTRSQQQAELPDLPPQRGNKLRERGTYLITGGLGGVGSLVAEWLARTKQARLVLVGRREVPDRASWDSEMANSADPWTSQSIQKILFMESLGAEVMTAAADVANIVDMERVVADARARFGEIHGVFHAAGTIQDDLIANKEQAGVEYVMGPKVKGAIVLDEVLADQDLDFMILFSSTSAILGPPGQVDYVAANAFLNAMARTRTRNGKQTTAIQWGVWNRVGMTADAAEAPSGRPQPVDEPLLTERITVGVDESVFTATLSSDTHWLLDEHRTAQGDAIVPGTGYLELAAEALAAAGETSAFEIRDAYFFQPLHIPDGESKRVQVKLRRSIEGYELTIQSELTPNDWQTHSQARLLLQALQAPARVDIPTRVEACPDVREPSSGDWIPSPQEAHLRFGPRWRVVRKLCYGEGSAVAHVSLAAEFSDEADEFRMHPALLDLATGFAMELIPAYETSRLWVPLTYRNVRVFGRLPAECVSVASNMRLIDSGGDICSVDIQICTHEGEVVVDVEGFQMKRLGPDQVFAAGAQATVSEAPQSRSVGGSAAEQLLSDNIRKGILPSEGMEALRRLLTDPMPTECSISSIPLPGLFAELNRAQQQSSDQEGRSSRPELDSDYVAPRDDLERSLGKFWEELLGVDQVGVHDSFFDLGGHSLIAVRLFAKIKKTFRVDYPISVLFEAPTIEKCAQLLRSDGVAGGEEDTANDSIEPASKSRFDYLVSMHPSKHGSGTPFFLVAGMFGNVLNLRHLAQLAGADRPFYGLQARGLFGDNTPHASFAEAASDYITELRTVQPKGPYLLGGFSGGGLTAYEMARQLVAAGERVERLILLDTPLPWKGVVGRSDRLKIQWQQIREQGPGYFGRWFKNRVRWEWQKISKRLGGHEEVDEPATFHSQTVEAAFRAALTTYQPEPMDVPTWLFRPVLDCKYDLGGGRYANADRELVLSDNGWTPFLSNLEVVETPGDHDGMVLEPNVRALAALLREVLEGL